MHDTNHCQHCPHCTEIWNGDACVCGWRKGDELRFTQVDLAVSPQLRRLLARRLEVRRAVAACCA